MNTSLRDMDVIKCTWGESGVLIRSLECFQKGWEMTVIEHLRIKVT